jgi:hypothetical protein
MDTPSAEPRASRLAFASLAVPLVVYIIGIPIERIAPYHSHLVLHFIWIALLPTGGLAGVILGWRAIVQHNRFSSRGIWMAFAGFVIGIFMFFGGLVAIWVEATGGKS